MKRLPFEPLCCHLTALGVVVPKGHRPGISALGWYHGSTMQRVWTRAKLEGSLTFKAADKIACNLGVHPTEIWGQSWYQRHTKER